MGAVMVAALISLLVTSSASAAVDRFTKLGAVSIPENRLFDLGVTDYDGDGLLDIFTANHKFHPALIRNEGGGVFTDMTGQVGFSQAPDFPGLEYLKQPRLDEDGVYLWVTDSAQEKAPSVVYLRSKRAALSGQLTFNTRGVSVERSDNARVDLDPSSDPLKVDFDVSPGALIKLRVGPIDVPFSVEFDPPPPALLPPPFPQPADPPVFVGTDAVRTSSRKLLLTIRDRHGYAFADVAADGATDAFAVSGGLGGSIGLPGYDGRVQDELLVGAGGGFANATPNSGLAKNDCRGRQAAAVDVDADGLLDLFEGCEGNRPHVYRQVSRGSFSQIRSPAVVGNAYRWAELGSGPRPELLAAGAQGIQVLRFGSSGWSELQTVSTNSRNNRIAQFALDDIDTDGDLDVLAVSAAGNTMFRNDNGRLNEMPLKELGLPSKSAAASFVDYDNDGRVDLFLHPQGLLRKVGATRFRRTGTLSMRRTDAAVTSWPDLNNDGLRDSIIASGESVFSKRKRVDVRQNRGPGWNWLEVDLIGTPGNAQAIGATVSIGVGDARQYQWVGQNDDSHFSQGHYRTYFGLGKHLGVSRLTVRWPGGATTQIDDVAANQLVRLQHP